MTIKKKQTSAKSLSLNNLHIFSNWALIGTFWILLVAALTFAKALFIPIFTALTLALIFTPVRRSLGKIGLPPGVAAALILASIVSVISILAYFLAGQVQTRLEALPDMVPRAIERIESIMKPMKTVIEASEQIDALAVQAGPPEVIVQAPGFLSIVAETTPRLIGQSIFTLALMLFLISSGDLFYEKLVQALPRVKDKKRSAQLLKSIEERVSSYFFTITLINLALGIIVGLVFWALGMPDPFFFGFLAFLLNYIPFVGAIIGVLITAMVALVTQDTVIATLIPPVAYMLLTAIEGQFLTPVLVGRTLRLNAVVVFLAVAMGAWMWSFMGMFLAIPLLIIFKSVSEEVSGLHAFGEFLGVRTNNTISEQRILDKALEVESGQAKTKPSTP